MQCNAVGLIVCTAGELGPNKTVSAPAMRLSKLFYINEKKNKHKIKSNEIYMKNYSLFTFLLLLPKLIILKDRNSTDISNKGRYGENTSEINYQTVIKN